MSLVADVLVLLLATAFSIPVARLSRAPLPLLQIVLGVILWSLGVQVRLYPETFMLLFVPPLLFADAVRIPKRDFFELQGIILALALGLVVFTTVAGGWASHAVLPTVPLAACLTLAAILSPTDTVAVTGLLGENAPRRVVNILEGESLLNDASGLVCFKFAAAAAMTGAFSLESATIGFGSLAAIGIGTGAAVALVFGLVDRALIRAGIEDVVTQTALTILLPFAVYLLADALGGSGILAAVVAGLVIARLRLLGEARGVTRLQITSIWRTITAVFNGLIFLVLGLQLPDIARSGHAAAAAAGLPAWGLPVVTVAVAVILVLLRLAWVTAVILAGMAWRAVRRKPSGWPGLAAIGALAVGGVRGAITLAGILSLPVATGNHPGFPDRDLLIGLAAGVIIVSLVLATALLPWLMRRVISSGISLTTSEAGRVRGMLAQAVIAKLQESLQADTPSHADPDQRAEVIALLLAEQTRHLANLSTEAEQRQKALARERLETAGRLAAVRIQRAELRRLVRMGEVADDVEMQVTEGLDRDEAALTTLAEALPRDAPEAA